MKTTLEDLLAGLPAQDGNGGRTLSADISAARSKSASPETQIDRTTVNARRVLDDEAQLRAAKTAQLRAARETRDAPPKG